jgi:hypothetical protein
MAQQPAPSGLCETRRSPEACAAKHFFWKLKKKLLAYTYFKNIPFEQLNNIISLRSISACFFFSGK